MEVLLNYQTHWPKNESPAPKEKVNPYLETYGRT